MNPDYATRDPKRAVVCARIFRGAWNPTIQARRPRCVRGLKENPSEVRQDLPESDEGPVLCRPT
jgi:hypothetical protein